MRGLIEAVVAENINYDIVIVIRPDLIFTVFPTYNLVNHILENVKTDNIIHTITNNWKIADTKLTTDVLFIGTLNTFKKFLNFIPNHNLDTIPFSTKLTYVAQTHVRDLNDYPPTGPCNLHSWSSHGNWDPSCYYSDHRNAELIWSKPKELIDYCSPGYEIAAFTSGEMIAVNALSLWQSSIGHSNIIFNIGIWKDIKFRAMGVAIYGNYAVVWFGELLDKSE
jgi:hypothetical protein